MILHTCALVRGYFYVVQTAKPYIGREPAVPLTRTPIVSVNLFRKQS